MRALRLMRRTDHQFSESKTCQTRIISSSWILRVLVVRIQVRRQCTGKIPHPESLLPGPIVLEIEAGDGPMCWKMRFQRN